MKSTISSLKSIFLVYYLLNLVDFGEVVATARHSHGDGTGGGANFPVRFSIDFHRFTIVLRLILGPFC